ncbi:MAG: hypothetical protein F6K36_29570 [Symploca sp. SIO3C6]|uniref:Actin-like protein N-terminal domain-containing protein n=1 Tax=Symploca sp. SIO1C4 TaxID=2607765 RepID=A0A6B3NK16_9CYAN|nr:hypothetical protein [Symploca sp. SIO3C6]NER30782.1 hypothetical protein [Symploca sp. SIO1C4]NET10726.1 hypothetical protein [Symploca sp. SIO2B6]NET48744.1 hypothetical protein [Merismopedia sp. SIO2A8]
MPTITQSKQAGIEQNYQHTPIGFDCGAGLTKLCFFCGRIQKRLRQPSKLLELKSPLLEELKSPEGGQFTYHSGNRSDLIGRQFLTGELAAWKEPTTHIKLSDDPTLKAEYVLHMVLGALASVEYRPKWNLFLVASTHSRALFSDKLKALTNGTHTVTFGGADMPASTVNITVGSVVPEGAGAYTYAKRLNALDSSSRVIGFDLGTSTVIPQVFGPGGKLIYHQPLETGGVIDLLEAIATDTQLLEQLGTGKSANLELIRKGLESGDFSYGTRRFNTRALYAKHIKLWLAARLRLAFKATKEWRDEAGSLIAWGGGSELPGVSQMLNTQGVISLPQGGWANALGLQIIATALKARRE